MAINENKRLSRNILQQNNTSYATLQTINNYQPANKIYDKAAGNTLYTQMQTAQTKLAQTEAALKSVRDELIAAEWSFHKYMLGVKDQVRAQFGTSSNELQGLGLKKKTEYKRTTKKSSNDLVRN
jgi:hypothetical protein